MQMVQMVQIVRKEKKKEKKLMSLHSAMAMGGIRQICSNGMLGEIDHEKKKKVKHDTTNPEYILNEAEATLK
jgi:preprotein translocase subunit YajC